MSATSVTYHGARQSRITSVGKGYVKSTSSNTTFVLYGISPFSVGASVARSVLRYNTDFSSAGSNLSVTSFCVVFHSSIEIDV
jgi:hypothetical protein